MKKTIIPRADYMSKKVSHEEYYGQFGKHLVNLVSTRIGVERIKKSKCPHFNDIPLKEWADLRFSIMNQVGSLIRKANGKKAGVSLSDCVCAAKAAARIIKEEK